MRKDRITMLSSAEEVDQFLARSPLAVVFKAGTCHQTDEAYARLQPMLEARPDLPFGIVRVVEARPASNHLAEKTGVRHASPQLLVFRDGRIVANHSHWNITEEALKAALEVETSAVPAGLTRGR